jgi:hypothetical protein
MAHTPLRPREQRHRRRSKSGKTDPHPAGGRMIAADQRPRRLDHDIGNKQRVARRDELLGAPLGPLRTKPPSREKPYDNQPRGCLDQAVGAKANQSDRAGSYAGADRDCELDQMPGVAARRSWFESSLVGLTGQLSNHNFSALIQGLTNSFDKQEASVPQSR